ncbi:hypothetical protein ACQJBY_030307 [Aegilops geniculata]
MRPRRLSRLRRRSRDLGFGHPSLVPRVSRSPSFGRTPELAAVVSVVQAENETTRYIFVYPEGGFIQQHIAVTSACHNMDDQQRFCDALEAPLILDSENHPSHDGVFGSF